MAKKKKPVDAEFNTIDMVGDTPVANAVQADPEATTAEKVAATACSTVDDEARAKLEQFDKLQQQVLDLSVENDTLKAKIAEYIEKLQEKPAVDPGVERELKELRDQNDQYLMRISELTFENAKLQSEFDTFKKRMGTDHPKENVNTPYSHSVYRGVALNGYSSWN